MKWLTLLLVSTSVWGQYIVTLSNDGNPCGGGNSSGPGGDLRWCLTQAIANLGGSITFADGIGSATVTLEDNLPSIYGAGNPINLDILGSGNLIKSNFSLFFINSTASAPSNVTISNLILGGDGSQPTSHGQKGGTATAAPAGDGGGGGGGAFGAGAAIFVLNSNVTVQDVSCMDCRAIGGDGGASTGNSGAFSAGDGGSMLQGQTSGCSPSGLGGIGAGGLGAVSFIRQAQDGEWGGGGGGALLGSATPTPGNGGWGGGAGGANTFDSTQGIGGQWGGNGGGGCRGSGCNCPGGGGGAAGAGLYATNSTVTIINQAISTEYTSNTVTPGSPGSTGCSSCVGCPAQPGLGVGPDICADLGDLIPTTLSFVIGTGLTQTINDGFFTAGTTTVGTLTAGSYSGTLQVNAIYNTNFVPFISTLYSGTVAVRGNFLDLNDSADNTRFILLDSNPPGPYEIDRFIGGSCSLYMDATNEIYMSQAENILGETFLNSGTLSYAVASSIGSGTIHFNGGNLKTRSVFFESPNLNQSILLSQPGTLDVNTHVPILSGSISGSGAFTLLGPGAVALTASNTFTGGVILDGGIALSVADPTNINDAGGATITFNDGALIVSSITITSPLLLNGPSTLTPGSGDTGTFTGTISGSGALTIGGGSGTIALSHANTYTGGTDLTGGTLSIQQADAIGGGTLTFDGGTFLADGSMTISNEVLLNTTGTIATADTLAFTGTISGSGAININGLGTVVLDHTNMYTGGTDLISGTLSVEQSDAAGTGTLTFDGGTLFVDGSITISSEVLLNSTGIITSATGSTGTFTGTVSGSGLISINGLGTIVLDHANTYTGGSDLKGGTLSIQQADAIGGGTLTFDGGAFSPNGSMTISNTVLLNTTGTLTAGGGDTLALTGTISGSGSMLINGTGTVTLSGTSNFTGSTTVSSSTLLLTGTVTTGAVQVTFGTMSVTGSISASSGNIVIDANSTLNGTGHSSTTGGHALQMFGTMAPGSSIGTYTHVGNWIFESTSHYEEEISASSGDLLIVQGDVTIDPGATFDLFPIGTGFIIPSTYTAIESTTMITGTFTHFTSFPLIAGTLSYDNQHVYVELVELNPLVNFASTGNCEAVAMAIDTIHNSGSTAVNEIIGSLIGLQTAEEICGALDAMQPAQFKGTMIVQENNALVVQRALNQRFQAVLDEMRYFEKVTSEPVPEYEEEKLESPPIQLSSMITVTPEKEEEPLEWSDSSKLLPSEGNPETVAVDTWSEGSSLIPADHQAYVRGEIDWVEWEGALAEGESPSGNNVSVVPKEECKVKRRPFHAWVTGVGDFLHQGSLVLDTNPQIGYGVSTAGFIAGIDYHFLEYFYAGALGAYTHSSVHWQQNQGKGHIDSGYAGLYFSALGKIFYGNASIIADWNNFDEHRNIIYPMTFKTAKNSHHGKQIVSHFDTGVNMGYKGWTFRPFDAFDWLVQHENGFVEKGAGEWDLAVKSTFGNMLRNELGMNVAVTGCAKGIKTTFDTKFSWVREVRTSGAPMTAAFDVAVGTPFTVIGYFPSRSLFCFGSTINVLALEDRLTCTAYYNGLWGDQYSDSSIGLEVNLGF